MVKTSNILQTRCLSSVNNKPIKKPRWEKIHRSHFLFQTSDHMTSVFLSACCRGRRRRSSSSSSSSERPRRTRTWLTWLTGIRSGSLNAAKNPRRRVRIRTRKYRSSSVDVASWLREKPGDYHLSCPLGSYMIDRLDGHPDIFIRRVLAVKSRCFVISPRLNGTIKVFSF